MSAIPLARFLVEFDSGGDPAPRREAGSEYRRIDTPSRIDEATAALIAEALERGQSEGRAAAETEFQTGLEAQRNEFEQKLAAERRAWVEQEGTVLAERMQVAIRDMEATIGASTAHILQPFLTAQISQQAVAELVAVIQTMVSKDRSVTLSVSGPADLVDAMRGKLAGITANVTFSTTDTPEVRVTLDQAVLQTNLGAWIARIQEAVA